MTIHMRDALAAAVFLSALGCDRTSTTKDVAARESAAPAKAPQAVPNTSPVSRAIHWPADRNTYQLGSLDSLMLTVPRCGDAPVPFSVDAVGPLHPGQTLAQVTTRCADGLAMWDWGDEGIPSPVLLVRFGAMTVRVAFEDTLPASRVTSLLSADSAARTPEGVGPGSSVAALEHAYGALKYVEGECAVFATLPRKPGISFRLDRLKGFKCGTLERDDERHWRAPTGTLIREMFVYPP